MPSTTIETVLVDGDIIRYSAGFASEDSFYSVDELGPFSTKTDAKVACDEAGVDHSHIVREVDPAPLSHCLNNVKNLIQSIQNGTGAERVIVYLSGPDNFRDDICTDYKAHRDPSHKPYWHDEIKSYLVKNYLSVESSDGNEADDELGIDLYTSWKNGDNDCCVATIDKDLDTIPGWHYNWRKEDGERLYWVSKEDADYNLFFQILTGDSADNIPGLPGIGPKKAAKILEGCCGSWESLLEATVDAYTNKFMRDKSFSEILDYFAQQYNLVYIRRSESDKPIHKVGITTETP